MKKIREIVQKNTYKNRMIYYCCLCVFIPCILCTSLVLFHYYASQKKMIMENTWETIEGIKEAQSARKKDFSKLGNVFAQDQDFINYFAKDNLSEKEYQQLFVDVEPSLNRMLNTNQDILNDVIVFTSNEKICQPEKQIYAMAELKKLSYGEKFLDGEEKHSIQYDKETEIFSLLRKTKAEEMKDAYVYMEKFFHVNGKQMCVLVFVISPEKMFADNRVLAAEEGYVRLPNGELLESGSLRRLPAKEEAGCGIVGKDETLFAEYCLNVDYSSLVSLKRTVFALYFLFFCAIILVMYFINRMVNQLFGRLNAVIQSMNKIKLGNFKEHIAEEAGSDEVSTIIRQFNHLLLQMEQNAEKLLLQEREKKDAEILTLQYQINPHFLCNSMNIIQLAVEEKGCYQISDAIASFVGVFRYNISGNMDATLQEELDSIHEYISFLSFCRNVKIYVQEDIPEQLKNTYMIKLLIQPVVENAIYHGYGRGAREISLSFRLKKEGGELHLEIENDGEAVPEGQLILLNERLSLADGKLTADKSQRIGLFNIANRMRLRFGPSVRIYMTSDEYRTIFHVHYPVIFVKKEEF